MGSFKWVASSIHSHIHPLSPAWYLHTTRTYWEKNQTSCVALVWQTTPHCVPKYFKTLLLSAYINVTFWHIYMPALFSLGLIIKYSTSTPPGWMQKYQFFCKRVNTSEDTGEMITFWLHEPSLWQQGILLHVYRNYTDSLLMPGSFCCWLTAWRCLTLMGDASPEAKAAIKEQCIKFAARICNR